MTTNKTKRAAATDSAPTSGSVTMDYAINLLSEIGSDVDFAHHQQAKIDAEILIRIKTFWDFK